MEITFVNNTGIFYLDELGPLEGQYRGQFVFRPYLTAMEVIAADREFRDLVGKIQTQIDPTAEFLAFALTQLKYRIISGPSFWFKGDNTIPGGEIADRNIIETVLKAATETEKQYKQSLLDKHENSLKRMQAQIQKDKQEIKTNQELEAPASNDTKK